MYDWNYSLHFVFLHISTRLWLSSSLARTWAHKLPLLSSSDKSLGLVGSSKSAFPAVPAQSEESPGVSWCSEERDYKTRPEYLLTEIFMAVIPHRFLRVALVAEPLLPTQASDMDFFLIYVWKMVHGLIQLLQCASFSVAQPSPEKPLSLQTVF